MASEDSHSIAIGVAEASLYGLGKTFDTPNKIYANRAFKESTLKR